MLGGGSIPTRRYWVISTPAMTVGRHLAEATYWILRKTEPYQDPMLNRDVSEGGRERVTSVNVVYGFAPSSVG
jgi:hypothetical protein